MSALRILHIEAIQGDQILIQNLLEKTDLQIKELDLAPTLDSVVNHLQAKTYDLVLIGLEFPKISGLGIIEQFRDELEKSCIIILSSFKYHEYIKDALNLGVQDFISKTNLSISDLERSILWSIGRHEILMQKSDIHQSILDKEERFQIFSEEPQVYVLRTDLTGRYTYYNDVFARTFLHGDRNVIGEPSLHHIIEEDHAETYTTVEKCMANPGVVYRVNLRKPGYLPGTVIKTTWEFVTLCDHLGNPKEIQCTGFDLSSKIKAQLDVQDSLRYQKSILESEQELFIISNQAGIIEFASGGKDLLKGGNAGGLNNQAFRDLICLQDRISWDYLKAQNPEKEQIVLELYVSEKSSVLCECLYQRIPNVGFSIIARKASHLHDEVLALQYRSQFLNSTLSKLPIGVLVINHDNQEVIEVNETFTRQFKYSKKAILSSKLDMIQLWESKEDQKKYLETIEGKARVSNFSTNWMDSSKNSIPVLLNSRLSTIRDTFCETITIIVAKSSK